MLLGVSPRGDRPGSRETGIRDRGTLGMITKAVLGRAFEGQRWVMRGDAKVPCGH